MKKTIVLTDKVLKTVLELSTEYCKLKFEEINSGNKNTIFSVDDQIEYIKSRL